MEAGASDQDQDRDARDLPPPEATANEPAPGSSQDQTMAYLAYILKEAEMTRARVDVIRRNTSIMITLLAITVIVMIIIWLDISGSIVIF